ncbi:MAG: hypothetical protein GY950_20470 [bacterium]|nr:hypothetical protein [bacterium]
MERFGVTPEKMQAGLDLFEAIKESNDYQELAKGESQKSTYRRNEVFERLFDWYGEFKIAARNAFEDDDPQELETMGILDRYPRPKRKKKPPVPEETSPEPIENKTN